MCEESACLVPPMESARNGSTESRPSVSSGSRAVSQNGEALVGFHEDALSHAAMGKAQMLLALVLGLALAADCSELTILDFIMPAAGLHLCIGEHRKEWLVSISLLAMASGSLAWGILGDHVGRRRALISALSVATLFSAVASVMPTYGTFMTARFCSGFGISGAFPLTFAYLTETCARASRSRYAGILHSMWPLGAAFTATVSHLTMPTVGEDIVQDNREHWSSWHKFLILSILPTVGCIIGLLWTSESPRYLLEASREVEALAVYQRLHKLNQSRTQYGLTELELPGRNVWERPASPSRNIFDEGLSSFKAAFYKISSPNYLHTTALLAAAYLLIGFLYMGVTTLSTAIMKDRREQDYHAHRKIISYQNFTDLVINNTMENVLYTQAVFKNVTFSHIYLSHVDFVNCTVEECEFFNVKASVSYFRDSVIKNSRFIDTDLIESHFLNCNLANNTFISLISNCAVDFDYNIYLDDLFYETIDWSIAMFPALLLMGILLQTYRRPPLIIATLCLVLITICFTMTMEYMGYTQFSLFVILLPDFIIKSLLMCSLNGLILVVVEAYPCHLRCSAHGIMRCLYHLGSLCAIPIYSMLGSSTIFLSGSVTIILTSIGIMLCNKIQDNSKVLL